MVPGQLAQVERQVPAGLYTIRAWAVDQAGNVGCDTTITTTIKGNPHKPGGLRTYAP